MLEQPADRCMPGFMIGDGLFFFQGDDLVFLFESPDNPVNGIEKILLSTAFLLFLAAIRADSLQTLAMSAPEKPGVCLARKSMSRFF